jgi:hypothetical protein
MIGDLYNFFCDIGIIRATDWATEESVITLRNSMNYVMEHQDEFDLRIL